MARDQYARATEVEDWGRRNRGKERTFMQARSYLKFFSQVFDHENLHSMRYETLTNSIGLRADPSSKWISLVVGEKPRALPSGVLEELG